MPFYYNQEASIVNSFLFFLGEKITLIPPKKQKADVSHTPTFNYCQQHFP